MANNIVGNHTIDYYVLAEESAGLENYGICVKSATYEKTIPCITPSQYTIQQLLKVLVEGVVTPLGLWDVVEDWLLA